MQPVVQVERPAKILGDTVGREERVGPLHKLALAFERAKMLCDTLEMIFGLVAGEAILAKLLKIVVAALLGGIGIAAAEDADPMLPFSLGDLIGSEKACGLAFDQSAIERFIEARAPAADLEFMGNVDGSAAIAASDFAGFTESQKTAHCAQARRVARNYGFIE